MGEAEDVGIDGVVRLAEHNNGSSAGHKMLVLMALPSLMRPWILCYATARKASPLAGRITRQLMSTPHWIWSREAPSPLRPQQFADLEGGGN
jgi:hypothetical protein